MIFRVIFQLLREFLDFVREMSFLFLNFGKDIYTEMEN